jgi:lysophospholipase II
MMRNLIFFLSFSSFLFLCSGLGDNGDGFSEIAQNLNRAMPYVKFIVPTAGQRPVTVSGGMTMNAWYDITGLTDRAAEDVDGIDGSVAIVRGLIQAEVDLGIKSNRIALAGFSQGGAMSLFTGLQLPIEMKLAGVLVLSGYLPGASKFKLTPGFEDVPVLHCHGTQDMVVNYEHAEKTKKHVTGKGLKSYVIKSYEVGHTVSPEIMMSAVEFLTKTIPNAPDLAIKPKAPSDMTVKELKEAIKRAGIAGKSVGFFEKREFVELLEAHRRPL